jgi:DivIVA domain-containing protein
MQRDEIERHDFPAARRGYDPAAVDAHLRRVADEFDRRPASLAEGASTQVRAIIDAAETSAQQLRDDAGREASGHVERVEDAAKGIAADEGPDHSRRAETARAGAEGCRRRHQLALSLRPRRRQQVFSARQENLPQG